MASFIILTPFAYEAPPPRRRLQLAAAGGSLLGFREVGIQENLQASDVFVPCYSDHFRGLRHQTSVFQVHLYSARTVTEVSDLLQGKTSLLFFF